MATTTRPNGTPRNGTAPRLPANRLFRQNPIGAYLSRHILAKLIKPESKDIGELAESMRQDYQIKLAEITLSANISAIKTEVKASGGVDETTKRRAAMLAALLQRLWENHISDMEGDVSDGRVAFEMVWEFSREAQVSFIRKLESLPFKETEMKLEKGTGKFLGINLSGGDSGKVLIPDGRAWWLALDPKPTEPHGKSRFIGAPQKVWEERQEAIRLRKVFIAKLVLMGGVAHVPDQITLEDGQTVDTFAAMAAAHDERLSGGLMILSNARDGEGNFEFEYTDPPSTLDPAPLDNHIDGLDQDQLLAFGIPPKTIMEGSETGSFAMVAQQRLILDAVVESILKQREKSFQKYVINKVAQANFPPGSGVQITISHDPLLSQQNQLMLTILETILTSDSLPEIFKSGAIDLHQLLKETRIPLLPGAELAIKKLFGMLQQAGVIPQPGQLPGVPGVPGQVPPQPGQAPPAAPANNTTNPSVAPRQAPIGRSVAGQSASLSNPSPADRDHAGRFMLPAGNVDHRRSRTRYTAHHDDTPGLTAAMANAIRDLKRHGAKYGMKCEQAGPHEDGSHTLHFSGAGGQVHVRVGKFMAMAGIDPARRESLSDIGCCEKPIGHVHGEIGRAKGLLEVAGKRRLQSLVA